MCVPLQRFRDTRRSCSPFNSTVRGPADRRLARVIFDGDDHIQGQTESSVLLRNVVKPEDVDAQYPSVGLLFCVLLSSTSTRDRC
jgi:hypothetical protein